MKAETFSWTLPVIKTHDGGWVESFDVGGGVFSGGLVLVGGATRLGKWKTPGQKKKGRRMRGKKDFRSTVETDRE